MVTYKIHSSVDWKIFDEIVGVESLQEEECLKNFESSETDNHNSDQQFCCCELEKLEGKFS
jgi:hypothetical protein